MFRILLAEDDKNLRMLYKSVMVKEGCHVYKAENGQAALAIFDHEHIDLVVCDAMTPVMDGYELVMRVKTLVSYSFYYIHHHGVIHFDCGQSRK